MATAQGEEGRYSALVFSRTTGFRHTAAINAGHDALDTMAAAEDFDVTHSEDAGDFTSHNLRNYDVVVFLNTDGEGILNAQQRTAFERWTQSGGGAVRIHADANADKAWAWKEDMMGGGLFTNHPPIQEATVEVADATHPATDDLPPTFTWSDEWYNFDEDPREDVHVLMTVDESTYEGGEHGAGTSDRLVLGVRRRAELLHGDRTRRRGRHARVVERRLPRAHLRRARVGGRRGAGRLRRAARRHPDRGPRSTRSRSTTRPRTRWSSRSPTTAACSSSRSAREPSTRSTRP